MADDDPSRPADDPLAPSLWRYNVLFTVFFGAAVIAMFTWWGPGHAAIDWLRARNWQSASCEIVMARLAARHGEDDDYEVLELTYRYAFGGDVRTGSRYKIGEEALARMVNDLHIGARFPCWVNPRNPAESVIDRALSTGTWINVLIGTLFIVGTFGRISRALIRQRRKMRTDAVEKAGPITPG